MPANRGTTMNIFEETSGPGRKEQSLELAVFLFLIVPSMVFSFFVVGRGNMSFVIVAVASILRDLGLVGLILFFLWRNGEEISRIGWTMEKFRKEAGLGFVLYIPLFFTASSLEEYLHEAGLSAPSAPLPALTSEKGIPEFLLAFLLVVVVAIAEETIFRGYLLLRLGPLTSAPAAVVITAVIFSLGHGYEGTAGVVTVGFLGAVFAIVYLWRKSLVAPVVLHFLQDFNGIVLVPLLRQFNLLQ